MNEIEKKSPGSAILNVLKNNTMLVALVAVMVLFEVLMMFKSGKGFNLFGMSLLNPTNVTNIINQNAYVVILAVGMLCCILTGGNIDLSVGSVVCLVGAVAGVLICNLHWNIYAAILVCLLIGTLIGAWHAFWIAYMHIPPFICTLSGMLLWRGVSLLILNGTTISPLPDNYLNLFNSFIGKTDATHGLAKKGLVELVSNDPGHVIINKELIEVTPTNGFKPFWQFASLTLQIAIIIGIACCVLMVVLQVLARNNKRRKGYHVGATTPFVIKQVLVSIVILGVSVLLGLNSGYPVILILIAIVVAAYSY